MRKTISILLVIFVIFTMCFGMLGSAYAASKTTHLEKSTVYVTLGGKATVRLLSATGKTLDATKVTWISANKKIATISKDGKVTGKSNGTATIRAIYRGKTYSCKVSVKYATKALSEITLYKGKTAKQIIYTAAGKAAVVSNVKFTSRDESIAVVDKKGKITAVSEGTVKIDSEYLGIKYPVEVTVISKNSQKEEKDKDIDTDKKKEEQQPTVATPSSGGKTPTGGSSTPSGGGKTPSGGSSTPSGGGNVTPTQPQQPVNPPAEPEQPQQPVNPPAEPEQPQQPDDTPTGGGESTPTGGDTDTPTGGDTPTKTKDFLDYTYQDYYAMTDKEQLQFKKDFNVKYPGKYYDWYDSMQEQKAQDEKEKESTGSIEIK